MIVGWTTLGIPLSCYLSFSQGGAHWDSFSAFSPKMDFIWDKTKTHCFSKKITSVFMVFVLMVEFILEAMLIGLVFFEGRVSASFQVWREKGPWGHIWGTVLT